MNDWFVTVLVSVRDMAAQSGMVALAEEMDVAILVAANESHERDLANLGRVDVNASEHDPRALADPADFGRIRRYH
ncbi:MAG: hypothetical protein AAGD13_08520 [Pseudomonadota bacterium]